MVAPLRVAHISATFPPYWSGTGLVCYHNARILANRGHDVHVFTSALPGAPDFEILNDVKIHRLKPLLKFGNAPLLPGLLRLKEFDLIHLHYPFIFGAELVWIVSRLRGIPYVLTHHNDLIGDGFRRSLFNAYTAVSTRLILSGAAKLLVVSKDHASGCRLASHFKNRWQDVIDMPNGVDAEVFHPSEKRKEIRARHSIPENSKVVLFVGGLDRAHHFKGVHHLIRAFAQLSDMDAYLLIVGEGDLKEQYEKFAAESGIENKTVFPGRIANDQMAPYYSAADVTVLSSFPPESFGVVLIESMACGTPVIASRLPGVRTVVADGVDGYLVEPGQVDDLAEKLGRLLSDRQRREEMGRCGRAKVVEKYTWPKIADRLGEAYLTALTDAHGPRARQAGSLHG
jgi:glycosyltransferase involved in cell wall biosynthesis